MDGAQFYLIGFLIALLLNLFELKEVLRVKFSSKSENLSRVGLAYSCFLRKYTVEKPTKTKNFLFGLWMLVIVPLFSWLSVCISIISAAEFFKRELSIPNELKLIQFQLSKDKLNKSEVIRLINELHQIQYSYSMDEFIQQKINNQDIVILDEIAKKIIL